MTDVKFDLQTHLQQMEARIMDAVAACHAEVKITNGRLRKAEGQIAWMKGGLALLGFLIMAVVAGLAVFR